MPAIDRYNGPLWQTLRAADPTGTKARVAFVSARYGFREAGSPIKNYDEKLTEQKAQALIDGGIRKDWPEQKSGWRNTGGGQSAFPAICYLTVSGLHPFDEVCLVGGHLYLEVMRSFVAEFRKPQWDGFETGTPWVLPKARVTEINGSIGIMRQQLRAWLDQPAQFALPLAA